MATPVIASPIILRPPTSTALPAPSTFTPPTPTQLEGTWHVTHSTLPMWRSKRNVSITYTPLPPSSASMPAVTNKLDDLVQYQTLSSDKIKTVHGIDTASGEGNTGAWDWRGKGWLMIASSHWEVLGWGDLPSVHFHGEEHIQQWAVTYFAKTLFTPAGIDVYSRRKEGLGDGVMQKIKDALGALEHEGVKGLVGDLFEMKRD